MFTISVQQYVVKCIFDLAYRFFFPEIDVGRYLSLILIL